MKKRVLLLILDGFGINEATPEENSITEAHPDKVLDRLFTFPNYTRLEASGRAVWLLDGFMGNSEVGHMTIGSGQIVKQTLLEINDHFREKTFPSLPAWKELEKQFWEGKTLHIGIMLWFAWVHAYQDHLRDILKLIPREQKVVLHLWTDGRDSGIQESLTYLETIETFIASYPNVTIASLAGRYYAMDRDTNWERTEKTYRAISWEERTPLTPSEYLSASYTAWMNDEFVLPASFWNYEGLEDGDTFVVMNFRPDRARQITEMLTGDEKERRPVISNESFPRKKIHVFTMTKYYDGFTGVVFVERKNIENPLGEIIANANMRQLHIAETEKFAHVTRFFNGVRTEPFSWEEDILIPSHKVEWGYDRDPEMSAYEILEKFSEREKDFDFIVMNLANGDMVWHSGKLSAGAKAVNALDRVVSSLVDICDRENIDLCITADHGNCEVMGDEAHPHTAHTTNEVPFWYISHGEIIATKPHGGLVDVAPTVLEIMGIPVPEVMEGKSLLINS